MTLTRAARVSDLGRGGVAYSDEGWHCGYECFGSSPEAIDSACYECNSCGFKGPADNRHCPECGKFTVRVGDITCGICYQGPVTETEILLCDMCGDWHPRFSFPEECGGESDE